MNRKREYGNPVDPVPVLAFNQMAADTVTVARIYELILRYGHRIQRLNQIVSKFNIFHHHKKSKPA